MSPNSPCPSVEFLRRSLDPDDPMPSGQRQQIERHVQMCTEHCQPKLEALLQVSRLLASRISQVNRFSPTDFSLPVLPARYEVREVIGRGGFGLVLRCRDTKLDRPIAVKILLSVYGPTSISAQRLRREARLTSRLQHPGIPPVYDVEELSEGRPYFTMKLIEGEPLSKRLRATKASGQDRFDLVKVFLQISEAVAYAHGEGVIHRDLKPGNIMVGRFGEVQVMDWGLAKELAKGTVLDAPNETYEGHVGMDQSRSAGMSFAMEDTPLTTASRALGTPHYMSPEQARGEPADKRSDVFGLGAILCQLLTGRPPYVGNTPLEVHHKATIGSAMEAFDDVAPGTIDASLVELAKRCLAEHPQQRPDDAGVVASFMSEYLNNLQEEKIKRASADAKAETEARARVELEQQLYATRIAVAERELTLDQDAGLASDLLGQCPEYSRGWEWHYLMRLRDGDRQPITGHDGGLWAAKFSPDGSRIATACIDGTAKIWDAATGRLIRNFTGHRIQLPRFLGLFVTPPRVPVMCVAFSPDGKLVASGSLAPRSRGLKDLRELRNPRRASGVVHVWDAATGQIVATFDKQLGIVDTLAYSPDGSRIASSSISEDHGIAVWEARTGRLIGTLRAEAMTHSHRLCYSPDGEFIASGSTDGFVRLWDAVSLRERLRVQAHSAPVYDLAFSADSRLVASASCDGTIKVWHTATGQPVLEPLRGHTGAAMGVAFSPDGKRIASGGWDKTVRLWDAATGVEKITLRRHDDMVTSVSFSPDGRRLISSGLDKRVQVWDASPVEEESGPGLFTLDASTDLAEGEIAKRDGRVNALAFSRDGRLLASAGWDMTARLWDGQTGKLHGICAGHHGAIWGVAFSPDDRTLATASWDRTCKTWDVATCQCLQTFPGHLTPLMGLAFSPRGDRVASCSFEGLVKLWDPATAEEKANCAGHLFPAISAAFSPDGARVASGSGDRTVKIWDVQTGRELLTLRGHGGLVHGVAFSPDGKRIATASWDRTVRLWNARNGKELLTLRGHNDRVQCVAFSSDGRWLASASEDKTVRVWDAATGRPFLPVRRHRGLVCAVAFAPDGKRLAAGCWSPSGWVKTWPTGQCG